MFLEPYFTETMMVVRTYFENRDDGLVSGKSPIYYHDSDGRLQWVMPDCYVAFGVDEVAIRRRDGYFVHEVGKPPDFVLEIASESTYGNDLGPKRKLYARLGIGEYWRFDATGGSYYGVALAGERLEDGEYRPMEVHRDSDGVRWGHSPALGLDLCWHDGRLRFYKPASGAYLLNLSESLAARTEAERTVSALAGRPPPRLVLTRRSGLDWLIGLPASPRNLKTRSCGNRYAACRNSSPPPTATRTVCQRPYDHDNQDQVR